MQVGRRNRAGRGVRQEADRAGLPRRPRDRARAGARGSDGRMRRDARDAARLARAVSAVRVAFIGAGDVAQNLYAPTLAATVELAGATDRVTDRARNLVEQYGGRLY